jgi:RNA polymerase sigma-19 factor, ECF subfamily
MASKTDRAGPSFAQLTYARYSRVLRSYLRNRVTNREDARELAQEVWTRLLRVAEPQKVSDPRRYIYRVAAHVVAEFQDQRRRSPVEFNSETFTSAVEDFPPIDDAIERLAAQRDVVRALQSLSPTFRDIILLRVRDGLSYAEIGERLAFSTETAKRYFFSAMALARSAWARSAK